MKKEVNNAPPSVAREIDSLSDEELWALYPYVISSLRKRNLIRTRNIAGERGEFLAIETYKKTPGLPALQAAPEGTQNVDSLSREGNRYSIKTITFPGTTTGVFYGTGDVQDEITPERKFEFVIVVLIDQDYRLKKMLELTWEQFLQFRRWHKTMRAWNLSLTKEVVKAARVIYEGGNEK